MCFAQLGASLSPFYSVNYSVYARLAVSERICVLRCESVLLNAYSLEFWISKVRFCVISCGGGAVVLCVCVFRTCKLCCYCVLLRASALCYCALLLVYTRRVV